MSEENRTRVWLVKTPEYFDAVIVAFAEPDSDECAGIFLYEPGTDPVELVTVGIDGVATEFEHASVTATFDRGCEDEEADVSYPGDEMITLAQRDADVAAAVEAHETLAGNHEKLTEQARALVAAVQEEHRATHEPGPIELCGYATCQTAREVDL
jgi:hypothetical protein